MTSNRASLDVNGPLDIDGWPVHLGQFQEGVKCYNQERNCFIVPCRNCRQMKWCLPTVTAEEQLVPPNPTNLLFYREFFDFFTADNGDVYDPCRTCCLMLERDKDFSVKYGTTTPTVEQKVAYHVRHQDWDRGEGLFFALQTGPFARSPYPVRTGNCPKCGASGSLWNRCRPCGTLRKILFTTRDKSVIINAHVVAYLTGEDFEPEHPLRDEEYGDRVVRVAQKLTLTWIKKCRVHNNLKAMDLKIHALAKMIIGIRNA